MQPAGERAHGSGVILRQWREHHARSAEGDARGAGCYAAHADGARGLITAAGDDGRTGAQSRCGGGRCMDHTSHFVAFVNRRQP